MIDNDGFFRSNFNYDINPIDIDNPLPRDVICIRSDCDTWGGGGDYNNELEIGRTYRVIDFKVGGYSTQIFIKELDKWFNSVLFNELSSYYK